MRGYAWESLSYRDFQYRQEQVDIRAESQDSLAGSELVVRLLTTKDERQLLQKLVPSAMGKANPGMYELLDREIRTGARLLRRFAGIRYPAELSEMVGYDMDAEEPYVLLAPYRGEPVDRHAGHLLLRQQYEFEVGLFRALRYLQAAKVVHGGITPQTVWWDPRHRRVQVVGFEHAVLIGEDRVRSGRTRWASLERREGRGEAGPQDDVWSAGAVVFHAVTGRAMPASGDGPELSGESPALAGLLAGVFTTEPESRTHSADLLLRLNADPDVPARADDSAASFGTARRKFDEVLVTKYGGVSPQLNNGERGGHGSTLPDDRGTGPVGARFPRAKRRVRSRWRDAVAGRGLRGDGAASGGGPRDLDEGIVPERNSTASGTRRVRCPICLDYFDWRDDELWIPTGEVSGYEQVNVSLVNDPVKLNDIRKNCYQRCPNPSEDTEPHHLPASYLDYGPPLVVGMVGRSGTGKTHLLTAMIAELERGGLQPYGLTTQPLDFSLHRRFQVDHLAQFARSEELPGTGHGLTGFTDVLLVTSSEGTWPVTFFDIAGEDFLSTGDRGKAGRFLIGANALIFVETPEHALGVRGNEDDDLGHGGNQTFSRVLSRLKDVPSLSDMPVSIVLNKSDRLRYVPPVDRWIRRQDDGAWDAVAALEESRDVYGLLYQHGAYSSLSPFHEFPKCTLHFASATGSESTGKRFVRGMRPMRVLRPLVALLAMSGVLTGPEARKVGSWHDTT